MHTLQKRTSPDGEKYVEVHAIQSFSDTWLTTIEKDQPDAAKVKENLIKNIEVDGGNLSFFDRKFIQWLRKGDTPIYHGHIGQLDEKNEEKGFVKFYSYNSPKNGRSVYLTACRPFPRQNSHLHCDYNSTIQFLEEFNLTTTSENQSR